VSQPHVRLSRNRRFVVNADFWGARASRVLVAASRRNNLLKSSQWLNAVVRFRGAQAAGLWCSVACRARVLSASCRQLQASSLRYPNFGGRGY
jgi:hypothetical protein